MTGGQSSRPGAYLPPPAAMLPPAKGERSEHDVSSSGKYHRGEDGESTHCPNGRRKEKEEHQLLSLRSLRPRKKEEETGPSKAIEIRAIVASGLRGRKKKVLHLVRTQHGTKLSRLSDRCLGAAPVEKEEKRRKKATSSAQQSPMQRSGGEKMKGRRDRLGTKHLSRCRYCVKRKKEGKKGKAMPFYHYRRAGSGGKTGVLFHVRCRKGKGKCKSPSCLLRIVH